MKNEGDYGRLKQKYSKKITFNKGERFFMKKYVLFFISIGILLGAILFFNLANVEKSKKVDIKGNDSVEVNWVSNPNTANELTSRVLTNNVYTVNGEEKKVLQILINNKITNNNKK